MSCHVAASCECTLLLFLELELVKSVKSISPDQNSIAPPRKSIFIIDGIKLWISELYIVL